jgi:hypothetical protein|uniref:Uncharacterized protein n=1 Tax=viral metagenome TaxID=1070528 RepID=A0A6C0IXH6_9ZZZZ
MTSERGLDVKRYVHRWLDEFEKNSGENTMYVRSCIDSMQDIYSLDTINPTGNIQRLFTELILLATLARLNGDTFIDEKRADFYFFADVFFDIIEDRKFTQHTYSSGVATTDAMQCFVNVPSTKRSKVNQKKRSWKPATQPDEPEDAYEVDQQ